MDVVQYACLLLSHLFSTLFLSSEAFILSNDTDMAALLQFKATLSISSSSSDHVLSSWNETTHFCNWEGITCGRRHQRVRLIDLHDLGLEGTISPYLGNLSFLSGINLNHNKFHGQIPPQLGLLHRLEDLNLSYNSLAGQIPINISHCSNLRILNLNRNQLLGGPIHARLTTFPNLLVMNLGDNSFNGIIPPSIGNLSTLRYLNLAYNNLTGQIPHSLGKMKGLKVLILSSNSLFGTIPISVYNISSLTKISLANNQLHGNLPMNMGLALPNLEFFDASFNNFVGSVPISLSNASGLQVFQISENMFSGKVPQNIGNLRYLKNLGLGDNNLRNDDHLNFLDSLANCSELAYLSLYRNFFTGRLSFISDLSSKLVGLELSANRFYGDLPTNISNLVGLQVLRIQNNSVTGNIPASIGMLSELVELSLSGNNLHGKIPPSICNGSNFLKLYLADNKLDGKIPSSIGKCNKLLTLQLSGNNLNGSIPEGLFTISSLSIFLDISGNFLNGTLPIEISNLKNLGILSVGNNKLTGEIPSSLGSCTSLEILNLHGNFFQGSIPVSLANVKNLKEIYLSQNNLSGPIPIFLGELKSLEFLNLSFNYFEGVVPDMGVFQNATRVDLKGNKLLCGGRLILHLQACAIEVHGKKKPKVMHVIIALLCCSFIVSLLCLMGIYYWRRKSKKEIPSKPILGGNHPKVSYQNLIKATNGFSSETLVGAGRYGTVYKGALEQEGTIVAIKVLNLQLHGADKTFNAECKALRNIKHRNLVKIITSCSSIDHRGNDFKALVFEFIPNGSLESWLHKSHYPEQTLEHLNLVQRLNVAIDVASALDYLHNQCHDSIIHCDLKPSNILLDDEMLARVGDFGMAKFVNIDSSNPSQGGSSSMVIKGSIGYVPPEYGIGGEISTRGDVYSYGVVLLELFIGRRPTDEISLKGLSIHEYVRHAFPRQVAEIVDPKIFPGEVHNHGATRECLETILQVGIACTVMSPHERPTIKAVLNDVHAVRTSFLR